MLSSQYIIKVYTLLNLLFLILLVANDLNIYFVIIQFISIYYGGRTIYCMMEGGCYAEVLGVFLFFFVGNIFTFLYVRNYIPNTVKMIQKTLSKFKNEIKKNFELEEKVKKRHNKLYGIEDI